MTYPLIVRSRAEADALEAYRWYENEHPGLGIRFLDALESGLTRISDNPLHYAEIAGGVRRKLLEKFPYGLFYLFENEEVIVIAIMHQEQRPDLWTRRK